LTTSFADYGIPSAAEVPSLSVATAPTFSPVSLLGAKGIGQAGAIGSTVAVQNAVVAALAPLGVTHLTLPLTPERVWRAIAAAAIIPSSHVRVGSSGDHRPLDPGGQL
jgi:carbon-monoxide dehydrogenase large subunit